MSATKPVQARNRKVAEHLNEVRSHVGALFRIAMADPDSDDLAVAACSLFAVTVHRLIARLEASDDAERVRDLRSVYEVTEATAHRAHERRHRNVVFLDDWRPRGVPPSQGGAS